MTVITEELFEYCLSLSTPPSEDSLRLAAYSKEKVERSDMLSGPLVGAFLAILARATRAKRILELGTYTGCSALAMAEQLPTDGEVITIDNNRATLEIARALWKSTSHGHKIHSFLGAASEIIDSLEGMFELIFIDADKVNYRIYLEKCLPRLTDRGLIVVDNCLYDGEVISGHPSDNGRAIREFNNFVRSRKDLLAVLLPVRDGLFLIQKNRT